MAVEERISRLALIRLDEAGVQLRQVHVSKVNLLPQAADHTHRLAKIYLGIPRRMRDVLVAQPLKDPLGRMPLLDWRALVGLEDRIDHWQQRTKLGFVIGSVRV